MKKSTFNMIGSLVFFIGVIVILGIVYLNSSSSSNDLDTSSGFSSFADLTSLESEAKSLISGRDNGAGVPLAVPKDKMGKTNPFSSP